MLSFFAGPYLCKARKVPSPQHIARSWCNTQSKHIRNHVVILSLQVLSDMKIVTTGPVCLQVMDELAAQVSTHWPILCIQEAQMGEIARVVVAKSPVRVIAAIRSHWSSLAVISPPKTQKLVLMGPCVVLRFESCDWRSFVQHSFHMELQTGLRELNAFTEHYEN